MNRSLYDRAGGASQILTTTFLVTAILTVVNSTTAWWRELTTVIGLLVILTLIISNYDRYRMTKKIREDNLAIGKQWLDLLRKKPKDCNLYHSAFVLWLTITDLSLSELGTNEQELQDLRSSAQ